MRKQSKTAASNRVAGKLTLPQPPLVDTFRLDRGLARDLQGTSRAMGISAEYIVETALSSFIGSADDDGSFRGDIRDNYVDDADDGKTCAVKVLTRKGSV